MSDYPEIEVQRDIFVFQSLIGCRISDFYRMTKQNLINGAIEYIPRKTKEGSHMARRTFIGNIYKKVKDLIWLEH